MSIKKHIEQKKSALLMPSIARQVHDVLQADVFLLEALARGIVGYRNLARWLKTEKGIDAAEETIVSAIRRFDPERPWNISPAKALLEEAHVHIRTAVTAFVLSRSPLHEQGDALVSALNSEESTRARILQAAGRTTLIVDDRRVDQTRRWLSPDLIEDEFEDVAEVELVAPLRGVQTPGVLGLVFTALSVRGVNVRFAVSGYPDQLIVVSEEDVLEAHDALNGLISSCGD